MIFGGDAPPSITDRQDDALTFGLAADMDLVRPVFAPIFDGVLQNIAQGLLQSEAIGIDHRQRIEGQRGLRSLQLGHKGTRQRLHDQVRINLGRRQLPLAFACDVQNVARQPLHALVCLGDRVD